MEPDSVLAVVQAELSPLIEDVRTTFADFSNRIPVDYRLRIERARPKVMHEHILSRWRDRYGTSAANPIRLAEDEHRLKFLFMEGDEFCVGLRNKRLNDSGASSQHVSKRQTQLRQANCFPEFKMLVAHAFLGYRFTSGPNEVEPRLIDISLSSEYVTACGWYDVRWRRVIWSEGEGVEPVRPIQTPLFPPPAPVIRPRKPKEGTGDEATGQQSG